MNHGLYLVENENLRGLCLKKVVSVLSVSDPIWHVDCLDCLNNTAFSNGTYTVRELLAVLETKPDIFAARLTAIPAAQQLDSVIQTSEDYLSSNCESLILCVDGIFYDVYVKDQQSLVLLYQNMVSEPLSEIRWIDDSFGGRTEFVI